MTVALEQAFRELRYHLRVLRDGLEALSMTAEEDTPTRNDVVVAARLSDALLAARGMLEEASSAADAAYRGAAHPLDTNLAWGALIDCQDRFHRFAHNFALELTSYERLDDLRTVGKERGAHWLRWAGVVRQGLEQGRAHVEEVRNAIFVCWQELTERIVTGAVSIQNTTIGQQFTMPEHESPRPLHADTV
jgi:hypothetical protein